MGATERHIICRQCGEHISMTVGSCPRCGADIRGRGVPIAALLIGIVLLAVSATDLGQFWLFALIGLFVGFGGGYTLYDRRRRIQQARPEAN